MSELTYKKIIDVEQVETLNDGTTVFINDNGAMKQVAANEFGLGTVKTVNGIAPDENGAVEFDKAFPVLITHMIFPAFSDIKCNKTCEEIYNGILTQEINATSIALLRYFSTSEEEYRYCTNVVLEKVDRNFTKRFFFYFGDDIAPFIVDVDANTITLDPDWVKPEENAGGSGGAFVVNIPYDDDAKNGVYKPDKTFAEIKEAYDNGMHIEVRYEEVAGVFQVLPLTQASSAAYAFSKGMAIFQDHRYIQNVVAFMSDGTVMVDQEVYGFTEV